jgi:hypothetical protein
LIMENLRKWWANCEFDWRWLKATAKFLQVFRRAVNNSENDEFR